MAVPFSNTKLRVPPGFQGLLEGIAKEVLQMQPNDIYAFSAVYFENLLQLRDSGIMDPVSHLSRIQDRMYNNNSFQKPDIDINSREQQDAAVRIQTKYRQHQSKGIVDDMRRQKAATKIQAGIRGHIGRKHVRNLRNEMASSTRQDLDDDNDYEQDPKDKSREYRDDKLTGDRDEERSFSSRALGVDLDNSAVQNSATKIQAGYHGMRFRQRMRIGQQLDDDQEMSLGLQDEDKNDEDKDYRAEETYRSDADNGLGLSQRSDLELGDETELELDENDPETLRAISEIQNHFKGLNTKLGSESDDPAEMHSAATKIQAGFKGMKTRKELSANKPVKTTDRSKSAEMQESPEYDSDSERAAAVIKIQAGFRGMKTRKEIKAKNARESETDDPELNTAVTKIQAGYRGMKTRKEIKNTNARQLTESSQNARESETDDPELNTAVTKIQAGYRGMRARKEIKIRQLMEGASSRHPGESPQNTRESEDDDSELNTAVTKIQAGYRGMRGRKEIKTRQGSGSRHPAETPQTARELEADDSELNTAVTKIQAGYRGMKTRKELKSRDSDKKPSKEREHSFTEQGGRDSVTNDFDSEQAAAVTKIQAGFRGMKTRKEVKANREPVENINSYNKEPDDEDDAERTSAVTKIQAGYRGMKTRKEVQGLKSKDSPKEVTQEYSGTTRELDADETTAVTKIQAGFRGMKTRKELNEKKQRNTDTTTADSFAYEPQTDASSHFDQTAAANKIQAGFRGYQTRKEVQKLRTERQSYPEEPVDDEKIHAANKIQAGFRGYKTRKDVIQLQREKIKAEEEYSEDAEN